MTNITNLILRSNYLARQIGRMEQILKASPEGKLYLKKYKNKIIYTKYAPMPDGTFKETYLNKGHPELAALANKKYAEKALADLYSEKRLVDKAIAFYQRSRQLDQFIDLHPEILDLISPVLRPLDQFAREWMEKPYQRSKKHPEDLKYPTVVPDLLVRSKAEADLVSRFFHFGVPFHYEEIQTINQEELAIDFTLLNVRAGRKLYWDHRGMADDPDYLRKTHYCEKLYLEAGIIPWVNMIVTAETKDSPLDIQWVDQLIGYYLL